MMSLRTDDICLLAAEMAQEHGAVARDYARRATREFEHVGQWERARFWNALAVLLDDIVEHRLDPSAPIRMH